MEVETANGDEWSSIGVTEDKAREHISNCPTCWRRYEEAVKSPRDTFLRRSLGRNVATHVRDERDGPRGRFALLSGVLFCLQAACKP